MIYWFGSKMILSVISISKIFKDEKILLVCRVSVVFSFLKFYKCLFMFNWVRILLFINNLYEKGIIESWDRWSFDSVDMLFVFCINVIILYMKNAFVFS